MKGQFSAAALDVEFVGAGGVQKGVFAPSKGRVPPDSNLTTTNAMPTYTRLGLEGRAEGTRTKIVADPVVLAPN